jgi:hypothetical protein
MADGGFAVVCTHSVHSVHCVHCVVQIRPFAKRKMERHATSRAARADKAGHLMGGPAMPSFEHDLIVDLFRALMRIGANCTLM